MADSQFELEKFETIISGLVQLVKKPIYWEQIKQEAGLDIDRLSASILNVLYQNNCQFQVLVEKVGIEAPSVSRKVHELEDKKLIIRKPSEDARVHDLHLSQSGIEAAEQIIKAKRAITTRLLSSWTETEKNQLYNLLNKLTIDMKQHLERLDQK